MDLKEKPGFVWHFVCFIFGVLSIPWWAYVATNLWMWFGLPLGFPALGMAHAVGLRALIGMFWPIKLPPKDLGWTEKEKDLGNLVLAWFLPAFAYTVGRVALYFM